jgi:hypothetical protein
LLIITLQVRYTNWRNNWRLDAENVTVHQNGLLVHSLPRAALWVKAVDSRASVNRKSKSSKSKAAAGRKGKTMIAAAGAGPGAGAE